MSLSTTFVVLAALCWGLSGGIGGILTAQGWDPIVVSFYRGAIVVVMVGVVLLTGIYEIGAGDVTPIAVGAGLQAVGMGIILLTITALSVYSSAERTPIDQAML